MSPGPRRSARRDAASCKAPSAVARFARLLRWTAAPIGALLLAGCGGGSDEPLRVTAAAPPLEQLAREIGGDEIRIAALTPAGGQPHDLKPGAAGNAALQSADLVLMIGGGFQPEVEQAVKRLPASTARLDLLGPHPLTYGDPLDGNQGLPPAEPGAADPHVWLDPARYGDLARRVGEALGNADPERQELYAQRAATVQQNAEQLDAELRRELAGCREVTIIATHAAWGYLTARYGLRQAVVGGVGANARTPRTTLQALRRAAEDRELRAAPVLITPVPLPRRVSAEIEAETGLTTVASDPLIAGTQDPAGGRVTGLAAIRANASALTAQAGCAADPGDAPATTPGAPPAA